MECGLKFNYIHVRTERVYGRIYNVRRTQFTTLWMCVRSHFSYWPVQTSFWRCKYAQLNVFMLFTPVLFLVAAIINNRVAIPIKVLRKGHVPTQSNLGATNKQMLFVTMKLSLHSHSRSYCKGNLSMLFRKPKVEKNMLWFFSRYSCIWKATVLNDLDSHYW
jgi:hypothetical protein